MNGITEIHVVENFIKEDDCKEFIKVMNIMSEKHQLEKDKRDSRETLSVYEDFRGVRNNKVEVLTWKHYKKIIKDYEFDAVVSDYTISIYREGSFKVPHIDDSVPKYGKCLFTGILYFNDDYEGGEISYPELNESYKPKAGTLILHPGNALHEVKPITSGSRYIVAMGFTDERKKDTLWRIG
jgi:hypothetical protein